MKTDRELLKLAAKAHGSISFDRFDLADVFLEFREGGMNHWNPLTDDGDALRLAAALELELLVYHGYGEVWADSLCGNHRGVAVFTENRADDYRHAIVRAAASIGEQMK